MKQLLIFLVLLCTSTAGFSQNNLKGVFKSVMILDKQPPKTQDSIKIGGLSAIEYYRSSDKKEPSKWIFALDRKTDQDQTSYLFENSDISGPIETLFSNSKKIDGLENVESVRYNPCLNTLFFALEKDDNSQIVYLDKKKKVQVFSTEKAANGYITENRGIEGLTFMPNNDKWYAFESGGCTDFRPQSTGTIGYV